MIGESPGREEDASGRPFVGRSGRFLDLALDRCHLRRDFMFITGSIKCHPPKNRAPNKGELEACKPYLLGQMQVINPPVLVLLGGVASSNLMGIPLNRARGKVVNRSGRLVLTTYHPSAAMRFPALRKPFLDDIATLASLLSGEP